MTSAEFERNSSGRKNWRSLQLSRFEIRTKNAPQCQVPETPIRCERRPTIALRPDRRCKPRTWPPVAWEEWHQHHHCSPRAACAHHGGVPQRTDRWGWSRLVLQGGQRLRHHQVNCHPLWNQTHILHRAGAVEYYDWICRVRRHGSKRPHWKSTKLAASILSIQASNSQKRNFKDLSNANVCSSIDFSNSRISCHANEERISSWKVV